MGTYIVQFSIAILCYTIFRRNECVLHPPLNSLFDEMVITFYEWIPAISLPSPDVDGAHNPYLASASPRAIQELFDIPIGLVNRVLYHEAHRRASSGPPRWWRLKTVNYIFNNDSNNQILSQQIDNSSTSTKANRLLTASRLKITPLPRHWEPRMSPHRNIIQLTGNHTHTIRIFQIVNGVGHRDVDHLPFLSSSCAELENFVFVWVTNEMLSPPFSQPFSIHQLHSTNSHHGRCVTWISTSTRRYIHIAPSEISNTRCPRPRCTVHTFCTLRGILPWKKLLVFTSVGISSWKSLLTDLSNLSFPPLFEKLLPSLVLYPPHPSHGHNLKYQRL